MVARYRGTYANCTHIIVSILKSRKVTVVDAAFQEGLEGGIECDGAAF